MSVLDDLFSAYPDHLKVRDLSAILDMPEPSVYRLLQQGDLPGYKLGGQWVILRDEVRQHMERTRIYQPPGGAGGDSPAAA